MKGTGYTGVLLGLACFVVLAQYAYCRSHFEIYTELCCENLSNSSDLRCWNKTQEMRNATNTTTFALCTQEMVGKACFNVTAVQPCQDDPAENTSAQGKKEIHIGAFVPFLKDDRYGYSNAMKMAIALINNRTDILNNYTLVLDSEDTHWVSVPFLFIFVSLQNFARLLKFIIQFTYTGAVFVFNKLMKYFIVNCLDVYSHIYSITGVRSGKLPMLSTTS